MTAKTEQPKTVYATRDFRDSGTGKSFPTGTAIDGTDATAGEIANYVAAGLASDKRPETPKPDAA